MGKRESKSNRALICLDRLSLEEFLLQKSLGLVSEYNGYIKRKGDTYYSIYTLCAISQESASEQLKRIAEGLTQKTGISHQDLWIHLPYA